MNHPAQQMISVTVDSVANMTAIGIGAVIVQHAAMAAMIDPVLPSILYGTAMVLIAVAKVIRAIKHDPEDNWIERKLNRMKPKKGKPIDRSTE
jgi:hypothetical protein